MMQLTYCEGHIFKEILLERRHKLTLQQFCLEMPSDGTGYPARSIVEQELKNYWPRVAFRMFYGGFVFLFGLPYFWRMFSSDPLYMVVTGSLWIEITGLVSACRNDTREITIEDAEDEIKRLRERNRKKRTTGLCGYSSNFQTALRNTFALYCTVCLFPSFLTGDFSSRWY